VSKRSRRYSIWEEGTFAPAICMTVIKPSGVSAAAGLKSGQPDDSVFQ
jgi:hypothetical protein